MQKLFSNSSLDQSNRLANNRQRTSSRIPHLVLGALFAFWISTSASFARSNVDQKQVVETVVTMLEQGHYSRQKLNNKLARQVLLTYMQNLDPSKLYFTQEDVDYFQNTYGNNLADQLRRGNISPAQEIFARFQKRVTDRITKSKSLLENPPFTFDSNRTVELNRLHANWPANEAEADQLWQERIEADLLQETLNQEGLKRQDSPSTVIAKRYDQVLRSISEYNNDDILKQLLSALAQTYDPHSDYLSPAEMENFAASMRLSWVGLGAVLKAEDGYIKVIEVIKGGPADRDGRLRPNDRIVAAARGNGDFEDVVDVSLDKVMAKIGGKKGSIVRLSVIPANATDASDRKIIDIKLDEVQFKGREARADLIEIPSADGASKERMGWITLSSFYANIDGRGASKSTTADVSRLLKRLKAEKINGLVVDLRNNSGGAMDEAIRLTGLFIPKGPVVQTKDSAGRITVGRDESDKVLYSGPLIVLMNRLSASASEVFAAALQDYGRAVIVGDKQSFGKGTAQQIVDVGQFMPSPKSTATRKAGLLKITVQKFYRALGGATQLRGVESDIVLHSLTDSPEIGESALRLPLSYDEITPQKVQATSKYRKQLDQLKKQSAARVSQDPEFQYIMQDMQRVKQRLTENQVSLNIQRRRAELKADKYIQEKRAAERKRRVLDLNASAYRITLDNVNTGQLESIPFEQIDSRESSLDDESGFNPAANGLSGEGPYLDPIRLETLQIMRDMMSAS